MRIATIQGPLQIGLDYSRDMPAGRANRLINPQLDEAPPAQHRGLVRHHLERPDP